LPVSAKQALTNITNLLGILLNEERKKQIAVGNLKVRDSLEK
jgi:hypothetical protein